MNFYHDSELNWQGLKVTQKTNYPWSGDVEFTVTPENAREFTMFLRIPAWSHNSSVELNGSKIPAPPGQYLALHRTWKPGDKFTLHLDMTPHLIAANPRISEDTGKTARPTRTADLLPGAARPIRQESRTCYSPRGNSSLNSEKIYSEE